MEDLISLRIPREMMASAEVGVIGERRVLHELTKLGFQAFRVENDQVADIIVLDNKKKTIQVKTSRRGFTSAGNHKYENYPFHLANLVPDFVICWAISDQDTFYVIPTKELRVGVNRIYPNTKHWQKYQNAWSLLKPDA